MEDANPQLMVDERKTELSTEAPWRWLSKGWADLWRTPALSLSYGAAFVAIGLTISFGLWNIGLSAMIPAAAGTFALVGPMMAVGLYEMSRRYETGLDFSIFDIIFVTTKSPIHIAYIGFLIMFGLLVWARITAILYALFANTSYMPLSQFTKFILETPDGLLLLIFGTIIGAGIALALFAMTAFSIPMLLDKKMHALEAVKRSVQVVKREPGIMMHWAWLIVILVGLGIITGFVGLIIVFPLLGHATWHAYREVFPELKNSSSV